ncbi:MAG: hypothetical protein PUP93_33550 [Rhizonema sp. NSF051]|nr:hypothetical protein [Rhizonema sp. NSF051]
MNRLQLEKVSTIIGNLCIHRGVPAEQIIYAVMILLNYTRLRLNQISRFLTYPNAIDKLEESEAVRRVSVRKVLPKLFKLLGTLHHSLVSITNDAIPLISSTPKREGT